MESEKKRVLIVDDEKALGGVLTHKFSMSGLEAVNVFNGTEAVAKLQTEKFDIILLDIMMPDLDGFGVLEKMKELNIKTPVIMLSSLRQTEDTLKAKEYEVVDYIVKTSVTPAEILNRVLQFFDTKK